MRRLSKTRLLSATVMAGLILIPALGHGQAAPARPTAPAPAEAAAPAASPVTAAEPVAVAAPSPEPVPQAAQRRLSTYTVELTNGRSVEATEVLSISRDMADGGLIIQMGDRAYRNAAEIDSEAARRRFNATIRELARQAMIADKKSSDDAAQFSPPRPAASSRPAAPPPPITRDGAMPGDLPKFNTDATPLLAPRKRNQPPPPPVPELNIADAIETYLQYKLSHTPEYTGRSVHVHASPGGGVAIEVDGQFYETVSEVANDDVRAFLAATIEEWQSRQ